MEKRKARPNSRDRILAAADEIVHEVGASHLSLDAVAERAGISKGGLLYNFPNKMSLLKAMVAEHLKEAKATFDGISNGDSPATAAVLEFIFDHALSSENCKQKPPIGFLAAIAEDPDLLEPVRAFHADILECLRRDPDSLAKSLIVYLAIEGIRSLDLMEIDNLTARERTKVIEQLRQIAMQPAT